MQAKLWDVQEITLTAKRNYENPYMDVDVWINLVGPDFNKRVYGFWCGGNTFKVRFTATAVGKWSYVSGSFPVDEGLGGTSGSFEAVDWTETEKQENVSRRGILRPSENGHGFIHPDGKDFFMVGDTWWSAPTYRFKWSDDDTPRPLEECYFKDLVQYRKKQGYNTIAMLAGHPTWANDGKPPIIEMEPGIWARDGWQQKGSDSVKDQHNSGGRIFNFPGNIKGYEDVVPNFAQLNPDYFIELDKKIDYLQSVGILSFLEVARRDISTVWKKYGGWPDTYTRFVQYIFARYQAHYCLLSPIHFDWYACSIPSREYNEPINHWLERYGHPPFGTLVGTNPSPSTLCNFGGPDEAPWLTFHQNGNWREHDHHWYLTECYRSEPAMPAIAGEPYYPGFPFGEPPETDSPEAELNNRAGLYGSFLSGAIGGVIYGVEGIWGGDIEDEAPYRIWESIVLRSGAETPLMKEFAFSEGARYQDLVPDSELVSPNKSGEHMGYRGWAFCAATPSKDYALIYLESECPPITIRGFKPSTTYNLSSFDTQIGTWKEAGTVTTDQFGRAPLTTEKQVLDIGYKLILP